MKDKIKRIDFIRFHPWLKTVKVCILAAIAIVFSAWFFPFLIEYLSVDFDVQNPQSLWPIKLLAVMIVVLAIFKESSETIQNKIKPIFKNASIDELKFHLDELLESTLFKRILNLYLKKYKIKIDAIDADDNTFSVLFQDKQRCSIDYKTIGFDGTRFTYQHFLSLTEQLIYKKKTATYILDQLK